MQENEKNLELRVDSSESYDTSEDYLSVIKDLKKNTVSKSSYDKLREENKQLLNSLVNGETIEQEKPKEVDIDKLRKELFNEDANVNNLTFISKALELRSALIEKGEPDPFLPIGNRIAPTDEDILKASKVATILEECVEYSQGDSSVFTNELQRRMVDSSPIIRKR
jgi:hypothetical protein